MKNPKKSSVYFQNIDALRFLAFFVVFIHHIFTVVYFKPTNTNSKEFIDRFLLNGNLGVSFFFVLSGFLITYLLLKEKELNNKINFYSFYLRRTLRIWPLYFFVLFLTFYLVPALTNYKGSPETEKILYVFFLGNFDLVNHGVGNFILCVLWSISIEEQFYLFWPILIATVPVKHLIKLLIVLLLFSIYYRLFGHSGRNFNFKVSYHTFSCMYSLVIGAFLAYFSLNANFIQKIKSIPKLYIASIYFLGFILIFIQKDILALEPSGSHFAISLVPVIYSFFFAFIIAEQIFSENSLLKLGGIPYLTKLGKISYGLYCYHMIAIFIVFISLTHLKYNTADPGNKLFLLEALISFALTILAASLSYNFIEKRFLVYKTKFSNFTKEKSQEPKYV